MICAREEDMKGEKKIERRGDKRRGIRPYHAASVRPRDDLPRVQTGCGASFRCISRAIASGAALLSLYSQSERPQSRAITTAVIEEEDR